MNTVTQKIRYTDQNITTLYLVPLSTIFNLYSRDTLTKSAKAVDREIRQDYKTPKECMNWPTVISTTGYHAVMEGICYVLCQIRRRITRLTAQLLVGSLLLGHVLINRRYMPEFTNGTHLSTCYGIHFVY